MHECAYYTVRGINDEGGFIIIFSILLYTYCIYICRLFFFFMSSSSHRVSLPKQRQQYARIVFAQTTEEQQHHHHHHQPKEEAGTQKKKKNCIWGKITKTKRKNTKREKNAIIYVIIHLYCSKNCYFSFFVFWFPHRRRRRRRVFISLRFFGFLSFCSFHKNTPLFGMEIRQARKRIYKMKWK